MDNKFTELIKQWLETPSDQRDYSVGALYLLKLSGNQIMYRNIVAQLDRRHDFVDYQIQKYYNFRVQALTHAQVEEMQQQVDVIVAEHISLAANADEHKTGKCLALKKVDSQKVNKMIKFQSLPRQKRQAIREEVLRMYAETDMSYVEIAEVNGVQLRTVEYIIRNFASELPETPVMRKNKKDASAEDYDALRAEITRLKKELRHEKMRAEALDTMIDVAEEMFNIPVRKKAGTKQ